MSLLRVFAGTGFVALLSILVWGFIELLSAGLAQYCRVRLDFLFEMLETKRHLMGGLPARLDPKVVRMRIEQLSPDDKERARQSFHLLSWYAAGFLVLLMAVMLVFVSLVFGAGG